MNSWLQQWYSATSPQIKLIILMEPLNVFANLNDDYIVYHFDDSFRKFLLSIPLKMIETENALVKLIDPIAIDQYKVYNYNVIHSKYYVHKFYIS
jgi:hypothetical protein